MREHLHHLLLIDNQASRLLIILLQTLNLAHQVLCHFNGFLEGSLGDASLAPFKSAVVAVWARVQAAGRHLLLCLVVMVLRLSSLVIWCAQHHLLFEQLLSA